MKYLVKQIKDADVVVGYEVKQKTDAKHLPKGPYIYVEGVDTKYPKIKIDIDGKLSIVEDTAPKELRKAFEEMDAGVVTESIPLLGTKNRETMIINILDMQFKVSMPELFVIDGLFAEVNSTSFGYGEPLDTPEKIKGYYSEVLYELSTRRKVKRDVFNAKKAELGLWKL